MKKVYISQPMNGKTQEEIQKERREAIEQFLAVTADDPDDITFIDSMVAEEAPKNCKEALWYLSKSIEILSTADEVVLQRDGKKQEAV